MLLNLLDTTRTIFLDFHRSQPFLLVYNLILQAILLLYLEVLELLLLFILLLNDFCLLCLFSLGLKDGFLDFSLLILTLLSVGVVVLSGHSLVFVCHLILKNFLNKKKATLRRALLTYLLNAIFITFLQRQNLISSLLSVINLLPSLLFFLLQKSDAICQ